MGHSRAAKTGLMAGLVKASLAREESMFSNDHAQTYRHRCHVFQSCDRP